MTKDDKKDQIQGVIIRSNRKTLSLTVTPDAELIIRAPYHLSEARIIEFVQHKNDWIRKRIGIALETRPKERRFDEGASILYLGEEYPISYREHTEQIIELGDKLFFNSKAQPKIREILVAWYIYQGYQIIPQRVKELSEKFNYRPNDVKITKAERRWGSCSSKGSLCFSWRLMMAPLEVIDYVIVHELVHLEVRDHSSRFWKRVESFMPDFRQRKKWLRENDRRMRL
ncbi:MAG: M48 family metallopeptidase [Candidatus Cloacimonetes bacterium]|nr:M48 family metallopeptidase [Candidatus Cloacimonadota bacterium]